MVAIVNQSKRLGYILAYNERKLKQEVAELIYSANYPKDTEKLSRSDKLMRLVNQAALNERTRVNGLHITLNFDPSDRLNADQFKGIAEDYMNRIGFGRQPYLVYRHFDSAHPHIHIVTTNIQADGKRISLYNLAANQSRLAAWNITREYELTIPATKIKALNEDRPVRPPKMEYGQIGIRIGIADVLEFVMRLYKFSSLEQLNALLKPYNVLAIGGSKESRLYKNRGLIYRVIDNNGKNKGDAVKASDLPIKATLKTLEPLFAANKEVRQKYEPRVRNAVELAFLKNPGLSMNELVQGLKNDQILLVIGKENKGVQPDLIYVDHFSKSVFSGRELGNEYTATGIQERLNQTQTQNQNSELSLAMSVMKYEQKAEDMTQKHRHKH